MSNPQNPDPYWSANNREHILNLQSALAQREVQLRQALDENTSLHNLMITAEKRGVDKGAAEVTGRIGSVLDMELCEWMRKEGYAADYAEMKKKDILDSLKTQ